MGGLGIHRGEWKIYFEDNLWLPFALFLMLVSFRWVSAALIAGLIHEIGHIAALTLLKKEIHEIRIGARGATICSAPMKPHEAIFSIIAGPVASLVLLLLYESFPYIAFCGGIQGLFNLLPFSGLDGFNLICVLKRSFRKIPCKEEKERVQ